ncbi:hypothetical protein BS47DRAFT_1305802 [Hydnum rufescens UP504]|uniref:Uncharacterized protein n=1 Tax=Hydnum rufescens UP504 TaxID=1448309 RepID=A0A9P6AHM3_9AGAM|nr:hypothetical protein BS47DRAFT_1305802 [Hydnum rufescens UP504]
MQRGLCGAEEPWWKDLGINIGHVLCQDALHGLHKAFSDHDLKWLSTTVGKMELDCRFQAQPHHSGFRGFPKGILHISQWSGKENCDVQCLILGTSVGSENASPAVIHALCSCLNFIYLAQLPQHSNATLHTMQAHLHDSNLARLVYIHNGSHRGKNGVINHMKFPKAHSPIHIFSNIRDTGVIDNYSTETSKTIHIDACKDPWHESNCKNYMQQVIH